MTLYRTGSNSEIVKALIAAAENGKQVAVAIELKARFDEQNNIVWARQLERAGVHVFYGSVGLKTHAKVILVVRQEEGQIRRYVHLSTGNYNVTTSRLYTDLGMFSADQWLGEDVSEVFNALSGFAKVAQYRKLAVAPTTLAETVLRKINEQTDAARAGKPSGIYAKMNALVDLAVIDALYAASQAGVQIDLCIRGICCLRPGLQGVSENIRVFSVVGRLLEHCRVFRFGTGEEEPDLRVLHALEQRSKRRGGGRNARRGLQGGDHHETEALGEVRPALVDDDGARAAVRRGRSQPASQSRI